jgi:hypothetical protein
MASPSALAAWLSFDRHRVPDDLASFSQFLATKTQLGDALAEVEDCRVPAAS